MKQSSSKYSAGIFVIAALSFLLPFVAASCNGQRVAQLSGIQLVTGTKVKAPSSYGYGYSTNKEVDPEPLAIIAFVATLAGIAFAFIKGVLGRRLSAVSGAIGFISLFLLQGKLNSDITKEAANLFKLDYLFGFWAALILLLIGAALNTYLSTKKGIPTDSVLKPEVNERRPS